MSKPFDPHEAISRRQRVEESIEYLKKKNPQKFAAAQVKAYEVGSALGSEASGMERRFGNPDRMSLVLKILDAQAEAYLELVDDMDSQEYYMVLLGAFGDKAFENQTGLPLDRIKWMASEHELQAIQKRVAYWVNEGYKRVASPIMRDESLPMATVRSIIGPLLRDKGFTPNKWAEVSGVDPKVVYNYLDGKSNPRPDSRKALADALGIDVAELP